MYFMLILVSGAKMQLPLQLGVTDKQTDSTTTVTLCACALRVNNNYAHLGVCTWGKKFIIYKIWHVTLAVTGCFMNSLSYIVTTSLSLSIRESHRQW